jgi:hypothetical protein
VQLQFNNSLSQFNSLQVGFEGALGTLAGLPAADVQVVSTLGSTVQVPTGNSSMPMTGVSVRPWVAALLQGLY